jgi:hypothetical protein
MADEKLSARSQQGVLALDSILHIVNDPSDTPVSSKETISALRALLLEEEQIASFDFDGAGSAISVGVAPKKGKLNPFAGNITRVVVTVPYAETGGVSFQIRKNTPASDVASTPTTIGTSSVANTKNLENDTTLSGYTLSIAAGDVLDARCSVNGGNITEASVTIYGKRT